MKKVVHIGSVHIMEGHHPKDLVDQLSDLFTTNGYVRTMSISIDHVDDGVYRLDIHCTEDETEDEFTSRKIEERKWKKSVGEDNFEAIKEFYLNLSTT